MNMKYVSVVILLLVLKDDVSTVMEEDYYDYDDNNELWYEPRRQFYVPPTPEPCYDFESILSYDFIVRGIVYNPLHLRSVFKYMKKFEIRGWFQIHARPSNEMTGYVEGRKTPMRKMKDMLITGGNIFQDFRSVEIRNRRYLKNYTMIGVYLKQSQSDLPDNLTNFVFTSAGLPSEKSSQSSSSELYASVLRRHGVIH